MFDGDSWTQIDQFFQKALDLPPDERDAYLDRECPDEAIRERVRSLIQNAQTSMSFLQPGGALAGTEAAGLTGEIDKLARSTPSGLDAGDVVGNYTLLRKLGEGGMGEVWEADQEKPIRRKVALKVVKWGMDTREVVARFDNERQALALMNHPNIARVYDGGATDAGRPFFVMERVHGVPVTTYCNDNRLSTRERLELFIQICQGVQHAHQKGIIHRDLKPSNVLVTIEGDRPVPKIIDFGIARATNQHLTENSVFTQLGQMIGTPGYMSPEQVEMSGIDIDTRTDVYSLGVLLYELLVGVLPFEATDPQKDSIEEIRRRIREVDPAKPSTRVRSLGGDTNRVAGERRLAPHALARVLRGDLDWIIMRALEKDRTRRYGSPDELAADIQRHLDDEAVLAGRPSAAYRMRKMVKRHRVFVTSALLIFLAMAIGIGVSTTQAIRANRAEKAAVEEAARATQEAETTEEVVQFLVGLFEDAKPDVPGEPLTARELVEHGSEKIGEELADRPAIQANLMKILGEVYISLGLYPESRELFQQAVAVHERQGTTETIPYMKLITDYGRSYELEGDFEKAAPYYEETLQLTRSIDGDLRRDEAIALNNLGVFAANKGDYKGCADYLAQSAVLREELGDTLHVEIATLYNNIGWVEQRLQNHETAANWYQKAIAMYTRLTSPDHVLVAQAKASYSSLLIDMKDFDQAETLMREALAINKGAYGDDHPEVAFTMHNLGAAIHGNGKLEEAMQLYEASYAMWKKYLGDHHPNLAASLRRQGHVAMELEQGVEAEEKYRMTYEVLRVAYGEEHPDTIEVRAFIANAMVMQERHADAEAELKAIENMGREAEDEPFPFVTDSFVNLYESWGRPDDAARYRTPSDAAADASGD